MSSMNSWRGLLVSFFYHFGINRLIPPSSLPVNDTLRQDVSGPRRSKLISVAFCKQKQIIPKYLCAFRISVKRKSTWCFGWLPLTKDLRKFGSLTKDKDVNFHPFCEEEPHFFQIFSNGLRDKAVFPLYRTWNFYIFFCKRKTIKFCFPAGNTISR